LIKKNYGGTIKIRVGDDKRIYLIDCAKVLQFLSTHPQSTDSIKGVKLVVIPLGKWGKKLGIYRVMKGLPV